MPGMYGEDDFYDLAEFRGEYRKKNLVIGKQNSLKVTFNCGLASNYSPLKWIITRASCLLHDSHRTGEIPPRTEGKKLNSSSWRTNSYLRQNSFTIDQRKMDLTKYCSASRGGGFIENAAVCLSDDDLFAEKLTKMEVPVNTSTSPWKIWWNRHWRNVWNVQYGDWSNACS